MPVSSADDSSSVGTDVVIGVVVRLNHVIADDRHGTGPFHQRYVGQYKISNCLRIASTSLLIPQFCTEVTEPSTVEILQNKAQQANDASMGI